MLNADLGVGCNSSGGCQGAGKGNCPRTPDFCIKKNDTRPIFQISFSDCDGAVDLDDENVAVEASMWFNAKLKSQISDTSTTLSFADNVGFDQIFVGDLVVVDKSRNYEFMIVTNINESSKSIQVSRGQEETSASEWPKGTDLKIFRFVDAPAQVESVFEDITQVDGSVLNELTDTILSFSFASEHTIMPGCYWFEFKISRILPGTGEIDWVKTIPLSDGFLINVVD
jgi:hypothetical protein